MLHYRSLFYLSKILLNYLRINVLKLKIPFIYKHIMLRKAIHLNKFRNHGENTSTFHDEYQYLNLIKDILDEGHMEKGRNGNVATIIGSSMHFSLANDTIPILTTKKTAWKTCLKELLWFVKGETSNKILNNQNVHIWDGNASKEFLSSRGLSHYEEGDLGPIYGYQWRHFNAPYEGIHADYNNNGIDQLQNVIETLKNPETRASRRMMVTAWNPCQLDEMALPPCHIMFQFNVVDGNKLSCSLYQRSVDCALGQPFNICSYAMLTHLIAHHCGLEPYEFMYHMGNCHIYEEHINPMKDQIEREPYEFPKIRIINKRENISDYIVSDFIIDNYRHHEKIKMSMVV
jgi:thymidylate synthase